MSSITCVCGTEEDCWPTISCTKCLFIYHAKCVGNESQDPKSFICLQCKSFSVMSKSRESTEKQNDNDHSGDEEDKESQETHYTAIQSTPTCLTITSSKIDKISRNSSRKRRNKGKEDQRKVKQQRYDAADIKSPIKTTNCFGPSKLQDAEILYKELAENIYSDELVQTLSHFQTDLNITNNNQVSLKNMETRKLKVQQSEHRRLVTMENIGEGEAIVEMRGSYMLHDEYEPMRIIASDPLSTTLQQQSPQNQQPHVFMYNGLEGLNICVDARTHGNVSRFVRFSANPNTELRHVINNNKVRLYLFARWQLMAGDEITLPITTCDDWETCGGEVKVELPNVAADTSCNKLLAATVNNENDEKQDFRRLSPIKLTIPKTTANNPQKTKPCGVDQSNNCSDNVDEVPTFIDNSTNRIINKSSSSSICVKSTTESGKVSSTPEQSKPKNRKRGRAGNRRPRETQSQSSASTDLSEQQRDDQFESQENCDRQSSDSATTSHQSCDLTSQDDVISAGLKAPSVCSTTDNSAEVADSKNMKGDNISTPDTKSSKMKAKKSASGSKAPTDIPLWFASQSHPLPPFLPGRPPEGGFRVQVQIANVTQASTSSSKSTSKPPKKHFLATARNDENLISETSSSNTADAASSSTADGSEAVGLNGQKSPPTKKLFLRRYQQNETTPDQQQTSSSPHVFDNLTNDADLAPNVGSSDINTSEVATLSLGEPITVITTNRMSDPLVLGPSPGILTNTPTPAKKKVSLSEYLRRKRSKTSDDKNKQQQKVGEGTEQTQSPVQTEAEDSNSRSSSFRGDDRRSSMDDNSRSTQQSMNESSSNPIPTILTDTRISSDTRFQLNSSRDCEKTKAYSITCPPPSFRINIDTPTKPSSGADVKQRSSTSLNHTPRRREGSSDSALLPTPPSLATIRPATKSMLMNEKLSPHSSSGGPPPYNPAAPAPTTANRSTPTKKIRSRGAVRKISSPPGGSGALSRSSVSSRSSTDSIYNGRRRNSPTHMSPWNDRSSPRHPPSSIIRMDEYSRRTTSPKYPTPLHHHQDIFEWESPSTFPPQLHDTSPHFTYAPAPSRSSPTHRRSPPSSAVPPPSHVEPKIATHRAISPFRRQTADYYAYNKRGGGGGESGDKTKYYYASHESGGYHRR